MKPAWAAAALGLLLLPLAYGEVCAPAGNEKTSAVFSPWDDVEQIIADEIGTARKQVRVQAYLLTSRKIAAALIEAHVRGVDVQIMADAVQAHIEASQLALLSAAGIPVWLETKYQNAHNKIVLIDAETAEPKVMTGSFNFTWTAQHKNAENLLEIAGGPCIALRYLENWKRHRQDAIAYRK